MYDLWFNKFHVFSKTNLYPSYKSQSILIEKIELSKFLKKGGIVSLKSPLTRIILSIFHIVRKIYYPSHIYTDF